MKEKTSYVGIVCGAGILSGKESMALELANGLREKGYAVEILTSFWGNGEFRRRSRTAGLPTHVMRLGFISATLTFECLRMTAHQLVFWPELLISYKRFLAKVKPDRIIHTSWHHALLLWPFLRPERDIYWVHETFSDKKQYRCLFSALDKRLGCFVAVSDAVRKSLVALGVPSNRIRVIYNGIADPARELAGLNPNANSTIGIVGQVGAWKGHEDLLQALRGVVRRFPTAELHIFGKGSEKYEEFLRARVTEAGIEKNVKWQGFISNLARIYQDVSVLAVPSRSDDPLPTSAIEAAFFALPVVASRRGGLPEIVEDDMTGLLFESGNTDELAEHLIRLLADPELRRKMGGNARKRAMCLFGHDRFVREFCEILELGSLNVAAINSAK